MSMNRIVKKTVAVILFVALVMLSFPAHIYAQVEQTEEVTVTEEAGIEKIEEQIQEEDEVSQNEEEDPEQKYVENKISQNEIDDTDQPLVSQNEISQDDVIEMEEIVVSENGIDERVLERINWGENNKFKEYVGVYSDYSGKIELKEGGSFDTCIVVKLLKDYPYDNKAIKVTLTPSDGYPVYLGRTRKIQCINFYYHGTATSFTLTIEEVAASQVNITIDQKYQGKIKFYTDITDQNWGGAEGEDTEILDGAWLTPGSNVYGKIEEGVEMVPVHMGTTYSTLDNGDIKGKRRIEVRDSSELYHFENIGAEDVFLDVHDGYYVQMVKQDVGNTTILCSYSENGGAYQSIPSDGYVPEGSRLKFTSSGLLENRALRFGEYGEECQFIYSDSKPLEMEITSDFPILIKSVLSNEVVIQENLTGQNIVSYYIVGQDEEWKKGMRVAEGDMIKVVASNIPSVQTIRINVSVYDKSTNCDVLQGIYYVSEDEGVCQIYVDKNWSNRLTLEINDVSLRKLTINLPSGYHVDAEIGEEWYSASDLLAVSYVPEGEAIVFYDGYTKEQIKRPLKVIRRSEKYPKEEGYLFNERGNKVVVKDEDLILDFEPVSVFKLDYDESILDSVSTDIAYYIDEYDGKDWILNTYIPSGEEVSLSRYATSVAEKYKIWAYCTAKPSEKVIEEQYLTDRHPFYKFVMPSFDVTVKAEKEERNSHKVTIQKNNFSSTSEASVKKYNRSTSMEIVRDQDEVYEDQLIRVNADSIAESKKMIVTFTKTGTNEYATGSARGVSIEGAKAAIFEMFHFPVTIHITEMERKGIEDNRHKPIYIAETISSGTEISYNVENGDLAETGQEIVIDVSKINTGKHVVVNVICPDENMVSSSGETSEDLFSRPYRSKILTSAEKITFPMPNFPLEIQVWETIGNENKIDIRNSKINLVQNSFVYTGQEIKPEFTVVHDGFVLKEGIDYKVDYKDNVRAGTGHLSLIGTGNYKGNLAVDFMITPRSLSDPAVNVKMAKEVIYNRKIEYKPIPEVTIDGFALELNEDFSLEYENNEDETTEGAEPAVVTIIGTGSMTGELQREFVIIKVEKSMADLKDAEVKLQKEDFIYTGEEIKPEFQVIYNNEIFDPKVDYKVSYHNNINTGMGIIQVTGVGSYGGRKEKEFPILKRSFDDVGFSAEVANQKYKKNTTSYEPKPIISYDGEILDEKIDYTLTYMHNTSVTSSEKPAKVIIEGHNNYSGKKELSFSIKKEDCMDLTKAKVKVVSPSLIYNGECQTPLVSVVYEGKVLVKDKDYKLVYQNNVNVGKAKVTVVGSGDYAGSKTAIFRIQPIVMDSSGYEIEKIPDEAYNGENRPMPLVSAKSGGIEPTAKDIVYTYKNNKKVGTATIIIKGKKNYKGRLTAEYQITKLNFDDYEYGISDCVYTGKKLKPDVIATNKNTGEYFLLKTGSAIKVRYFNNKEVGDARAVFSPKNQSFFENGKEKEILFQISECNLKDVHIMPIKDQKEKNGKQIKPKLDVRVGKTKLKMNKQYKVEYGSNNETGIGTATILPADEKNFNGSQTVSFLIR